MLGYFIIQYAITENLRKMYNTLQIVELLLKWFSYVFFQNNLITTKMSEFSTNKSLIFEHPEI